MLDKNPNIWRKLQLFALGLIPLGAVALVSDLSAGVLYAVGFVLSLVCLGLTSSGDQIP